MEIKFKKLNDNAVVPTQAHATDAGFDLVATSMEFNNEDKCVKYGTGISVEIPEGYVGLVFPRSSVYKKPLALANSVGVIDSGYRGEIKVIFRPIPSGVRKMSDSSILRVLLPKKELKGFCLDYDFDSWYNIGDRIAQLVIVRIPKIAFKETDKLSDSERGNGGLGSTGRGRILTEVLAKQRAKAKAKHPEELFTKEDIEAIEGID